FSRIISLCGTVRSPRLPVTQSNTGALMPSRLDGLLAHIAQLEQEVEHEVNRARAQWRYRVEAGRVRFERDVHLAQQRSKQSIPHYIRESSPLNILTAPIIYSMVVPIALIDASFTIYQ